ncbi:MAG: hypothetical protein OEY34_08765 [Cyclobacteriaceae bacterium]|nr:hypothetical protein [Cyclobacteriaceae bacterium]
MNITELTHKENQLSKKVLELYNQRQTTEKEEKLQNIFDAYRQVHQQYAEQAEKDNEALKRGLFIQWYALVEPNHLTGINDIDEQAEEKIIQILNQKIENNELDDELDWMLNYYMRKDWVFDRFNGYKGIVKTMANKNYNLPESIDNISMAKRGQMGMYWNSLTRFEAKE